MIEIFAAFYGTYARDLKVKRLKVVYFSSVPKKKIKILKYVKIKQQGVSSEKRSIRQISVIIIIDENQRFCHLPKTCLTDLTIY